MRRLAALAALLLLTGCGLPVPDGVQSAGRVAAEREQPLALEVIPPRPQPGATPEEIVSGFLLAQRSPAEDHAVAREFLAPGTEWDDERGAVIYRSRRFTTDDDTDPLTYSVRYDTTARIEPTGEFAVDDSPVTASYTVAQMESGEYRLTSVPPGLHLTPQDRERSFTAYDAYFLGREADGSASGRLVPDRLFVPVSADPADPAPALVAALLRGATLPLRPAVTSALPEGTELASPVTVVDEVVTVDLAGQVRELDQRERQRLSAQLVWTLVPTFSGVRVLADGEPLEVEGVGEVQDLADWESYDPTGVEPDAPLFYVQGRQLQSLDGALPDSEATSPRGLPVDGFAVHPTTEQVALLTRSEEGAVVRTGPLAGPFSEPRLARADLRSLSWGPGEQGLWAVAAGDQPAVCLLPAAAGAPAPADPCAVSYERPADAGPLQVLRVSRDGARVALVFGEGDGRRLYVGRIEPSEGGLRIAGVDPVAPTLAGVADVAWESGTSLAVLASSPGASQVVAWRVAVDGSTGPAAVQRPGLPGDGVGLAAAPGRPLVVSALLDGVPRLYRDDGTLFRLETAPGTAPAYPG